MPRYEPSAEEMDESYGNAPVKPPEEKSSETESVDEENSESTQVLVSNKVLTGPDGETPKEGDEIVVKVVKNYGDESSIIYAPSKKSETESTPSTEDEIAALDTKGNDYAS